MSRASTVSLKYSSGTLGQSAGVVGAADVGTALGPAVGVSDGLAVGMAVGCPLGAAVVGDSEGREDGI